MKNKLNSKGFTLVELLAVIIILAIIVAIAVPRINSVLEEAKQGALNDSAVLLRKNAEQRMSIVAMGGTYDADAAYGDIMDEGSEYGLTAFGCDADICTLTFGATADASKFSGKTANDGPYTFANPTGVIVTPPVS